MKKIATFLAVLFPLLSSSQMTTVGFANQYTDCGCYQLTSGTTANTKGAIWSPQPIDLTSGFDMTFDLYFGANDVWGADGMTFVLQQNSTGIGDYGHALGYKPPSPDPNPISANSLAVEFDGWNSSPTVASDIDDDHVGLSSNGSVEHNLVGPSLFPGTQNIEDGAYHEVRIVYDDGTGTLIVFWEGDYMNPILTYTNPNFITDHFSGNSSVYWGFTASTGGVYNEMRVCSSGSASAAADITTLCPGSTVNFTGTSSSDTGIINSWSWDFGDGGTDNAQNPSYVYNTSGTYWAVLTVTDGFGCGRKDSVEITVLPDLILNMDSTAVTCYGGADGVAVATPANGSSPYTYLWNDPSSQTTQTASGLSAGTYSVVVTDDLGCTGEDSVIIDEPLEMILNMASAFSCFGDSTGEASVSVTNGVAPYSYAWDDYNTQITDTAVNLPAGMYTVTVTDDSGCVQVDSVTINENPQIVITGTTTSDNGTGTGAVDITVTGGSGSTYTYSWDNGETTEDISNLFAGNYTVMVTDSAGCSEEARFTVESSAGLPGFSDLGIKVYPNPTTGQFTIKGNGDFQLEIMDTRGRKVYQSLVKTQEIIDFSSMEKGVYILTMTKDGNKVKSKLILQ